ncbi:3-isopropylmalate dehydratase large subunit [Candidatus Sulfidibacterium hydrothermale]|uniref:aconitase/3-isopropylmalate dehydratase large subunit family protein n=1 Tax=Candidatus Sulfidibacterium hydrothermale TaxID=2875962 RepID=UPI001F0AF60F|nr:aconitase/3-isopropylmalate dehydratase large subunit family protein [Candidatus Sulfidibacterium hydrothermale]UBM61571.1 3-isopropylmalate dehydratase large subunit [Candidatus Sulfidibacterium hydrothermale]
MTIIEKIIAAHSVQEKVKPGDIVDIEIDARVARDFGGPNVVKNIETFGLTVDDPSKTFFTFDTNPTGSDQKYAANQQVVRVFARKHGIKVFDINNGIGTHTLIREGLAWPGSTAVTTDSHANILGAIGAFGQGMGDKDIAAAFHRGKVWFKVPPTVKLNLTGQLPEKVTAKDIVLNLLHEFGANKLLGMAVEFYGDAVDRLTLDQRITIASMGTEMGVIILLFPPNREVMDYCEQATGRKLKPVLADSDAQYIKEYTVDVSRFVPMVSRPGKPHNTVDINTEKRVKIDSAFVGSCTNGRMEDMRTVARILKGRKVAPGVVLKIVPATDKIWRQCLDEGLLTIFKDAGALVSNAGCAGCAAGQVGQNGPGEVTISTGNRNFPGKQGKGLVYLASPASVAASAVAGYITTEDDIPERPAHFDYENSEIDYKPAAHYEHEPVEKPVIVKGRVWLIRKDDIDTDMIFHNRYLQITDPEKMGQYIFDNLEGYEDFAKKVQPGDIVVTGKNFGAGSSRQQAVDGFKTLGVQAILAESFGAIYERNAINAALPVLTYESLDALELKDGDVITVNFETGEVTSERTGKTVRITPFSQVQMEIYKNDGLF